MPETMSGRDFAAMIQAIQTAMEAAQSELNALDSALGDGDHGGALAAAFTDSAEKISGADEPNPAEVLRLASQSLLNRMGGASGALYGTFFLRMSLSLKDHQSVDLAGWQAALRAGLEGVIQRGKASPGDKTMIDALAPAVEAFSSAENLESAFRAAAAAAQSGAEATRSMIAKFGRAKFVGERAIGHIDAGAQSMALLFAAMDEYWREQHGQA